MRGEHASDRKPVEASETTVGSDVASNISPQAVDDVNGDISGRLSEDLPLGRRLLRGATRDLPRGGWIDSGSGPGWAP